MTNKLCQCPHPGFCSRHKIDKNELMWQACRGESTHLDCGRKFWRAWEIGNLGATIPDDPQPDVEWECNQELLELPTTGRVVFENRIPWPADKCVVGRRVKLLLKEEHGVTASGSCECNKHAAEMDRNGCDWCQENIETIVDWMLSEVWKAPIGNLIQSWKEGKLVHNLKSATHPKEVLRDLVQRAINTEQERISLQLT